MHPQIERRKAKDLASPIPTRVVAANLMTHVAEACQEQRALLQVGWEAIVRCFRHGCGPHHRVVLACGSISFGRGCETSGGSTVSGAGIVGL